MWLWRQHSCGRAQLWYSMAVKTAWPWNSSNVIEHSYKNRMAMRQLWGQASLQLDSTAPLLAGPLWWDIFGVSAQPGKRCLQSLVERKNSCAPRARGELIYINRSPCPWSLINLSSCKWGLQIHILRLVQKALSWLVRMELLWSVKKLMGDIAVLLWLDRKSLSWVHWHRIPGAPL